jgi:Concanavalin A-like lectin/glucanases superfamily/Putative phage tail protein
MPTVYVGGWNDAPSSAHLKYFDTKPPIVYTPPPPVPLAQPVTPTFDPKIEANALYGKPMALFAGGFARIGASPAPIVGPYIHDGVVDFIVSFGVPANVAGIRKIYAIWLDNELAWSSVAGGTLPGHGTFAADSFDFIFKSGTLTQTACSLETTKFPGDECAYRPQMLLQIIGIPIARFMANTGKPVPYVACDIGDVTDAAVPQDGINLGEALERIALSPWAGYTAASFESVGITDIVGAILIKDNFTVTQLCQSVAGEYRNIDVLLSDKLRVKDRGSVTTPDFLFDRDMIIGGADAVSVVRAGATEQRREHELIAIDPDQDYTAVPSLAKIPREPFVISAAVQKDTATVPLVIDASTRQALATFSQQYKENARRRVALKVSAAGYEIEPGDLFALVDIADGFDNEVFKCTQTAHGANYVVDLEGEAILRCSIFGGTDDPHIGEVVLLLHMEGAAGSTSFFDSSSYNNPVTTLGLAQISASSKYGSGALVCHGTGADCIYASVATLGGAGSALSATNTSPYTIECWANFSAVNVSQFLIAIDTGALGRFFRLWQDSNDELQFIWDDTGGVYDPVNVLNTTTANLTTGVWYHIAVDKDSTGKIRIYVNGVMFASGTPANSVIGMTGDPVSVGGRNIFNNPFNGYIDEVRITRMISRYGDVYGDGPFSPPSDQFPDT